MQTMIDDFLKKAAEVVGHDNLVREPESIEDEIKNTLGFTRQVPALVYPGNAAEVQKIVVLAAEFGVPIYPVSCGKNMGYGERLPVRDGQLIVDLRRMNRIRSFDAETGVIVVEPGVTQAQLYKYLQQAGAKYFMDATGAGLEASIVGNTLEGGFGHGPLGNRRESILELEVVLGSGEILCTGLYPGCGPNLSGIFVQSNYGIVTALTFRVSPVPEVVSSYVLSIENKAKLGAALERLAELRRQRIIESLPHVGNAVRTVMTIRAFSDAWNRPEPLTDEDASRILSRWWMHVGEWNGLGALYGSKRKVADSKRAMVSALRGVAKVRFFERWILVLLENVISAMPLKRFADYRALSMTVSNLLSLHGLQEGVPFDLATENIGWRVSSKEDLGLIWFAPTVQAKGQEILQAVRLGESLFKEYGFEMPLTITLVTPERVVLTFNITFNKNDQGELSRAHALYSALNMQCQEEGFMPYRCGVQGSAQISYSSEKLAVLRRLKEVLDPCNIIAPGRSGIG